MGGRRGSFVSVNPWLAGVPFPSPLPLFGGGTKEDPTINGPVVSGSNPGRILEALAPSPSFFLAFFLGLLPGVKDNPPPPPGGKG